MALDSQRILDSYKSKGYTLTSESEVAMKDLLDSIINEIITNAEVSTDVNVIITNPSGLITSAGPVTGATLSNANTSQGIGGIN